MRKKSKYNNKSRFNYKGHKKHHSLISTVKVSERVALKTPAKVGKCSTGGYFMSEYSIPKLLEKRQKLIQMGFPVARYKGTIIDESKRLEHERKTLITKTLKDLTYADIERNIDQIYAILENAAEKRVWIDPRVTNFGMDNDGKIKIFDFSHIYYDTKSSKRQSFLDNFDTLKENIGYKFGVQAMKKFERSIKEYKKRKR